MDGWPRGRPLGAQDVTVGGSAAWARPARNSTLSGLCDRVRVSWGGAHVRARHRLVLKATENDKEAPRHEDLQRVIAAVWESGESRWLLLRLRERPIASDHVVAFKAVALIHRVLQQGPPHVASEWVLPNPMLDGLAGVWGSNANDTRGAQAQHCHQAVADFARMLSAKIELMVERDAGTGRFDGSSVFSRLLIEPSDLLQALAMLLNFADKLMPLALHLVTPSKDWRRLDKSQYMRLYLGAIPALLDEAWLLLCAVSLFVKNLLCQVHEAKQCDTSASSRGSAADRPPWLQLSHHLLAARARFVRFHSAVCDVVAHCHQLRCAGFSEIAAHIPTVPQGLPNLFADLDELVSRKDTVKEAAPSNGPTLSSASTAIASSAQNSDSSIGGCRSGELSAEAPTNWEPSRRVLDALRTVDSLQNSPLLSVCRITGANIDNASNTASSGSPPGERSPRSICPQPSSNRNLSAPAVARQRREEDTERPAFKPHQRTPLSNDPTVQAAGRGYMLLEDESDAGEASSGAQDSARTSRHHIDLKTDQEPVSNRPVTIHGDAQSVLHQIFHQPAGGSLRVTPPAYAWPTQAPTPLHEPSTPSSWATAICQSNAPRDGDKGHNCQPLFTVPLWRQEETAQEQAPPAPAQKSTDKGVAYDGPEPTKQSGRPDGSEHAQDAPTIPLNPFDLSASQLHHAIRKRSLIPPDNKAGNPFRHQEDPPTLSVPRSLGRIQPEQQDTHIASPTNCLSRPDIKVPGAPCISTPFGAAVRKRSLGVGTSAQPVYPNFGGSISLPVEARSSSRQDASSAAPCHVAMPGTTQPARDASPLQRVPEPETGQTGRRRPQKQSSGPLHGEQLRAASPGHQCGPMPGFGQQVQAQQASHTALPGGQNAAMLPVTQPKAAGAAPVPVVILPVQGNLSPTSADSAEWEVNPAEMQLEELLGCGSTAEVYRASWHGTDVAVKKIRRPGAPNKEFTRELSVLLRLRHPNLVLFMGASRQVPPLIISEFCAGGTVFSLLHQQPEKPLPWQQRLKMAIDVAKGMNFLHRRQVVHRDLKSLNLLLSNRLTSAEDVPLVKVSDFGLSRALSADQPKKQALMTCGAGTYHWMAPEVLSGHSYDEKVDVYSYGICLFELLSRRIPYDGSGLEPVSIAVAVSKGKRPDMTCIPRDCPADLRFTMECCWAQCPTGRPGFDTILETLKLVQCL